MFADALGVDPSVFSDVEGHSVDVLRMNNYALRPARSTSISDLTGMGEHTDYGIVTVLWADQVRGLQVLGADRHWQTSRLPTRRYWSTSVTSPPDGPTKSTSRRCTG